MGGANLSKGTKLAMGIVLLWLGGGLLFIAFMSGKVDSLAAGTAVDSDGNAIKDASGNAAKVGPQNTTQLLGRINANLKAAQGG